MREKRERKSRKEGYCFLFYQPEKEKVPCSESVMFSHPLPGPSYHISAFKE